MHDFKQMMGKFSQDEMGSMKDDAEMEAIEELMAIAEKLMGEKVGKKKMGGGSMEIAVEAGPSVTSDSKTEDMMDKDLQEKGLSKASGMEIAEGESPEMSEDDEDRVLGKMANAAMDEDEDDFDPDMISLRKKGKIF